MYDLVTNIHCTCKVCKQYEHLIYTFYVVGYCCFFQYTHFFSTYLYVHNSLFIFYLSLGLVLLVFSCMSTSSCKLFSKYTESNLKLESQSLYLYTYLANKADSEYFACRMDRLIRK